MHAHKLIYCWFSCCWWSLTCNLSLFYFFSSSLPLYYCHFLSPLGLSNCQNPHWFPQNSTETCSVWIPMSVCLCRPNLVSYYMMVTGRLQYNESIRVLQHFLHWFTHKIALHVLGIHYWFQTDSKIQHLMFMASKFLDFIHVTYGGRNLREAPFLLLSCHLTLKYKLMTNAMDSRADNLWWNWESASIFSSLLVNEMVQSFTLVKVSQEPSHQLEK